MTTPLRTRRALTAALLLSLPGCASLLGRSEEDRGVTIELRAPRSTAVRRSLAALREQGYRAKESLTSGLEITTETFRHDAAEAVFRVVISGSAERARVRITGTYRERQLGGIVRGREREIQRASEGLEGELWARLVNLGLAIRGG